MTTKLFTAALIATAAFAGSTSFAAENIGGEVGYVQPAPVAASSGLSRAAVHEQVLQAVRSGTLPSTHEGANFGVTASTASTVTREAVRADAVYAVQHGRTIGGEV